MQNFMANGVSTQPSGSALMEALSWDLPGVVPLEAGAAAAANLVPSTTEPPPIASSRCSTPPGQGHRLHLDRTGGWRRCREAPARSSASAWVQLLIDPVLLDAATP